MINKKILITFTLIFSLVLLGGCGTFPTYPSFTWTDEQAKTIGIKSLTNLGYTFSTMYHSCDLYVTGVKKKDVDVLKFTFSNKKSGHYVGEGQIRLDNFPSGTPYALGGYFNVDNKIFDCRYDGDEVHVDAFTVN